MRSQHDVSDPPVPAVSTAPKRRKITNYVESSDEDEISSTMQQLDLAVNPVPKQRGRPKKANEHTELQKLIEVAIAQPIANLSTGLERALKLLTDKHNI